MSKEIKKFEKECAEEIRIQGSNLDLKQKSIEWLNEMQIIISTHITLNG